MSSIPFEQISFIVQGPVDRTIQKLTGKPATHSCIESIRRWFPGSEIILSTWAGSDVSGLNADVLVTSTDPGGHNFMAPGSAQTCINNGNRQIVSTKAGLLRVQRKFAAKVRSDVILQGNQWLEMLDRFPERAPEWRMFRSRIITGNLYTRNPLREIPKPFHPSDWFMFGLTEDLLMYWDVDPEPEPESSYWFRTRAHPKCLKGSEDTRRYQAEQYLWKTLMQKFGSIQFDNLADSSPENVRLTQLTFANNLIILDVKQFPFVIEKHRRPVRLWRYTCFNHREWKRLYNAFCRGKRLSSVLSRLFDPRYLFEAWYVSIPSPLRAQARRLSRIGRNLVNTVRPV